MSLLLMRLGSGWTLLDLTHKGNGPKIGLKAHFYYPLMLDFLRFTENATLNKKVGLGKC